MSKKNLINSNIHIDNCGVGKFEYLLVFILLFVSGNPIAELLGEWIHILFMVFLFLCATICHKPVSNSVSIKWALIFIVIFLAQAVSVERVSFNADINFLAKLYSCFLLALFLGEKFRYAYMKIMVILSLISLPLFAINFIGIEFGGLSYSRYVSLILYNYIPVSQFIEMRNCGMFWEPGAFQGYLMLVPLLYIGNIKDFFCLYKKECIILIAALLTTMSTTGYLAFALLLSLVLFKNIKNILAKFFLVGSVILVSLYAFENFDFIGEKLLGQYENSKTISHGEVSWSRMGAAQIDFYNIMRHPFVGNGFLMEQKYYGLGDLMAGAGNGFTGVINSFGIPFMLLFLYAVFRNAPSKSSYDKMIFLVIFLMLLNGEYFLNYPFFWVVLFMIYPQSQGFSLTRNMNFRKRLVEAKKFV